MERLEPVLLEAEPDVVLVPGDVNSTMAAAIATSKLQIPLGHVEAGLRSFDRTLPEELNRVVADQLSQLLFIHSPEARDNLLAEGCPAAAIHDVGNTMIDSLVAMRERIDAREAHRRSAGSSAAGTSSSRCTATGWTARSSAEAMAQLAALAAELPIVFPVHPRTRAALEAMAIDVDLDRLLLLEPLGYIEFMSLVAGSAGVLTDSGGIQEETTFLGLPCFTLRPNTERPVTSRWARTSCSASRRSGSPRCRHCSPRRPERKPGYRPSGTAKPRSESPTSWPAIPSKRRQSPEPAETATSGARQPSSLYGRSGRPVRCERGQEVGEGFGQAGALVSGQLLRRDGRRQVACADSVERGFDRLPVVEARAELDRLRVA